MDLIPVFKCDEIKQQVLMNTDRQGHELRTSLGRFIDEQGDVCSTVEELARRIDAIRDGTHPRSGAPQDGTHPRNTSSDSAPQNEQRLPEASVAMQLEVEDLKMKVARLTEQSTAQIGTLFPLTERVDLAENQIMRWRYSLPELTNDEDRQPIVTALDVQEQLTKFQELTRGKIHEIRQESNSLEEKILILERARSESWELVSQRLNSLLERSVGTLSERMTELEQTVQSQRTTSAADRSSPQVPSEEITSLESGIEARYQAFSHEVERVRDEWERALAGQCDLLDFFERKQSSIEKQVRGLKSFASHVERFLEQYTLRWRSHSSGPECRTRKKKKRNGTTRGGDRALLWSFKLINSTTPLYSDP